jgi:hypothetical protein
MRAGIGKMAREILPVHTLNARGDVRLDVVRDELIIPPDRMLFEIQAMRKQVVDVLKAKGVNCAELRGLCLK